MLVQKIFRLLNAYIIIMILKLMYGHLDEYYILYYQILNIYKNLI